MPFTTPLRAELIDDLANKGAGEWRLLDQLVYVDARGIEYVVPAGFSTDFASVPRIAFAYWLTGNTAHRPAVLHDWLCRTAPVPRTVADQLFAEAMESIGMPKWRLGAMFRAVSAETRNQEAKNNPPKDEWGVG